MRRALVVAAVVLVVLAALGWVLLRDDDDSGDDASEPLTITWSESEERPACVYVPDTGTVEVKLAAEGDAGKRHEVTATVTAYADENTSRPVGSNSLAVELEGRVDELLVLTIPVQRPPHVDEDGVAACRLEVDL